MALRRQDTVSATVYYNQNNAVNYLSKISHINIPKTAKIRKTIKNIHKTAAAKIITTKI